ncbi:hypothetical protein SPRG_11291 [Saprolegnia parasitica CBS 223.65]|uniref:ubiquitinyl hydrolase 1 n=1 Tax=Saprolegnia parasitica (strain CBS 223.65) TaxID=695850 RepID=A0A067C3Z1_SAPPC|nr:hypothetical protein SPRG_11291 [Saprolegnia parasitica CBS 223.65]KDO23860.1 hypothetical protein SPRG_11291 [Saprolegnia parasitica CBS 223.65]|eukprot:XP_012205492.1 hypothetical protein SPRG_11291 [Saprolegnia parasitica CBS 223.65]
MATADIYHEPQQLMRCGVHAANNLLQRRAFEAGDFDALCTELCPSTWRNPHRGLLGNYDIEVLSLALLRQGCAVTYFDVRKPLAALPLETCVGLICNVPQSSFLGLWQSRHWFCIREVHNTFYNLDSKLAAPEPFQEAASVRAYLAASLATHPSTTILVVTRTTPLP